MNFEFVVWSVFVLTVVVALRATLHWKVAALRMQAVSFWIAAAAIGAIGLALAETRWFPTMANSPHGSPRQFLLLLSIPTILLFGIVIILFLLQGTSDSRFLRGMDRIKHGLCPNCAYPQSSSGRRCSECGWPCIKADSPLIWPTSPPPMLLWPLRKSSAQTLYVRWGLTAREDAALPSSADPGVFAVVAGACLKECRWPNAIFHRDDQWMLVTGHRSAGIKMQLLTLLGLNISHAEFAGFCRLTFGEVVDRLSPRIERGKLK